MSRDSSALQAIEPLPPARKRRAAAAQAGYHGKSAGNGKGGTRNSSGAAAKQARTVPAGTSDAELSTTQRIVLSVTAAIVERRLMPGTKLSEQKIADIFKVSRTLVRQALNQLSRDRLVTLEPARGAFVARPSVHEAREVFEVRHMLESAMARKAALELTPAQLKELRAHLKAEQAAIHRTDVPGRTSLLADFHVVLAHMLGNGTLAEMLRDLLSRSSLIALMYQSAHSAEASFEDHVAIVDAFERRDPEAAARLMQLHIGDVERNLRLDPRVAGLEDEDEDGDNENNSALMPAITP